MAPAFTKLLGSGEIAEDFQDKLPTEAMLTAMQQMLKPLALIKAWTLELQAEDRPTAQLVIPAMFSSATSQKQNTTESPAKARKDFAKYFFCWTVLSWAILLALVVTKLDKLCRSLQPC